SWGRFFFFQAEDGIRDRNVTGVQTCALPIFESCLDLPDQIPAGLGGECFGLKLAEDRHALLYLTSSPRLKAGDSGTTYRWFGAFAPSRVAPWPSCFDTDRPVREDSR